MEYYAKSGKKILSQEEIDKVRNELENLIINLEEEFTETDLKVIKNNIAHLQDTKEEEQKTLKEHQDDIVRCAEMFFLEYGEYFTEKEKCLVTEACRIHDWGKVNLIFQRLVNPNLIKKMYPDIKQDTQIPHGFLSAVTISKKEFKRLSELFSEEDFGPFITAVYHHHDRDDCYEGSEIRKYAEKYYLKQIKEYLGKDIDKLYCSNLNKLLYRNNTCTPKFTVDSKIWNEYLLIKGLLNKFDYIVSAGYEDAEIVPDLREKKLKKNIEVYLQNKELRPAQKFMMEHKNENLIIVAPTGSGKTEILKMIAGLEQQDSGNIEILINDTWTSMDDYGENRMQIRKNMGFMHQEFALTPHTPVIEQLASKLSPKMDEIYEKARQKASEIGLSDEALDLLYQLTDLSRNEAIVKLEKLNLGPEILDLLFPSINQETVIEYVKPIFEALDLPLPLLTRQFIELSGGQQVRVAIASVLISNPDILILDEPFGDLDPVTLRIVANSLKKINEKLHTTIILVSHTMEFVEEVSTRTILINKGKLIDDGEPSTVTAKFLEIEGQ